MREPVFAFLRKWSFWLVVIIVLVSLISMRQTGSEREKLSLAEEMVRGMYVPLEFGVEQLREGLAGLEAYFADKKNLVRENKRLKREILRYQFEQQVLMEYKYEALRLRKFLQFQKELEGKLEVVGAKVVARSPDSWYKTITINKGSSDGVQRDMVVIAPYGLVGRVTSVTDRRAVVLLVTDREGAVGAVVQRNRTPGIIEGLGNNNLLRMTHIPYAAEKKPGELVVTSHLSEIFPPGLRIGRIKKVVVEPSGLMKTAIVVPAVDMDKLEEVFLVTSYRPNEKEH